MAIGRVNNFYIVPPAKQDPKVDNDERKKHKKNKKEDEKEEENKNKKEGRIDIRI
jgi:hypothetical protein